MSKLNLIGKGNILIAEPFLLDPNFKKAVVLLTDYSYLEGAVGFVLNKKINMNINQLLADFPEFESEVLFGGPVQNDTIHYIHDKGDVLDGSVEIMEGLYWGGDYEKLKFLIEQQIILPQNIRFFVGYAGWGAGQLDEEMQAGSWVLSDMDPNYLFKQKELWKQTMMDVGETFGVIATTMPHMN